MNRSVKAEISQVNIPTYELGKPEKNPVFFEKRVYQGSSGKVYPIPFIDKVYDHKINKGYQAAILENEFVRLVMLPEIGGRIFEAQDKSNNNYDFFYKQEVIKPALVGLAGPWISGGVEFNWPQHHRPGTYLPTDVHIEHETDGAKTVWMSEYDPMDRLKGMHGIRIRPDSALVELRVRLFNRTPLTQTFLWWANVAVEVHKDYQSFFPPDVHYVADHAVRAMSSFPLAENHYYGIPYHERQGKNDLRRYDNIPVPTSYMVCDTQFDFFGGYDYKANCGFVHVANRHIAPGKKQWTWGSAEFGKAWYRELTDIGGPYLELMAGVYTDNQPDFSYLMPYETKTFSQFWWGYQKLGPVQNANEQFAIRLDIRQGYQLDLGVAASELFEGLTFLLKVGEEMTRFENISVSPEMPWQNQDVVIKAGQEYQLSFIILDKSGKKLLSYQHKQISKERSRKVAREPLAPRVVESTIELQLIAEHLEQYRHPTRYPEIYLEEAIHRDIHNHKARTSLGRILLKKGLFIEAESHFRHAIEIITDYHPNAATGEPFYFGGLACVYQEKLADAYGLFYKATWNYAWRSAGYYQLALLDCRKGDLKSTFAHLEASLDTNRHNNKAFVLKASLLRQLGRAEEAKKVLANLLAIDPLDQWARYELACLQNSFQNFLKSSRNDAQTMIDLAFDYAEAGLYKEAVNLLELHHGHPVPECVVPNSMKKSVMTKILSAWLNDRLGNDEKAIATLKEVELISPDYFFPSRLQEKIVLEWALEYHEARTVVAFGLGNFLFDQKLHQQSIAVWEKAVQANSTYAILYRNLGITYWNTDRDGEKAQVAYQKAVDLAPNDTRIRYEQDQLLKKCQVTSSVRLRKLEAIKELVLERDDFCVEYANLLNIEERYSEAKEFLERKNFHPWEGGEGQVLLQYSTSCLALGKQALEKGNAQLAYNYFVKAWETPDNLGEKYHPLQAVAHINYWKGKAQKELGNLKNAQKYFEISANEQGDFIDMAVSEHSGMTYYRALSLRELGKEKEAVVLLNALKDFAEKKINEDTKIDYFATSLPSFLVFEDDLQLQNEIEGKRLLALAEKGLSKQVLKYSYLE